MPVGPPIVASFPGLPPASLAVRQDDLHRRIPVADLETLGRVRGALWRRRRLDQAGLCGLPGRKPRLLLCLGLGGGLFLEATLLGLLCSSRCILGRFCRRRLDLDAVPLVVTA